MLRICVLIIAFTCAASVHAQGLQPERTALETLVSDWKQFHNSKDLISLKSLYDSHVFFYGDRISPEGCIKDKAKYLNGEHDFVMSIKSDLHFTTYKGGIVKCSFIKSVYFKHKLREYPSYLVLKKAGNKYKIIAESDKYADQGLAVKPDWGEVMPLDQFLTDTMQTEENAGSSNRTWIYWLVGGLILGAGAAYLLAVNKKASRRQIIPVGDSHDERPS